MYFETQMPHSSHLEASNKPQHGFNSGLKHALLQSNPVILPQDFSGLSSDSGNKFLSGFMGQFNADSDEFFYNPFNSKKYVIEMKHDDSKS